MSKSDVFLDKDIESYGFSESVQQMLSRLMKQLCCTGPIPSGSLAHHVDGLFCNHPDYGTRIIEFDEEQHFSAFRIDALRLLSDFWGEDFLPHYAKLYERKECFNRMLKKHRFTKSIESIPDTIDAFVELVQDNAKSNSRYVEAKSGFNFIGGRMAQRAFYDTLRDVAHLSPKNSGFRKLLRCSMFEFEIEAGLSFPRILQTDLEGMVAERLNRLQ